MTEPTIGGARLVTADDVCRAVEAVLDDHMGAWARASDLEVVTTWQQVPTPSALSSATLPAGAITSPGLTKPPTQHRGAYEATWRVAVAVYARGTDHNDTASRVRRYAALIRAVLVQHPRLGGLALRSSWVGEDYALLGDQGSARTLGGCAVSFDVVVDDVVATTTPPELTGAEPDPVVLATPTRVSVRRPVVPQE